MADGFGQVAKQGVMSGKENGVMLVWMGGQYSN